jgi:uncharacterized UPF0146 family protein
MHNPIKGLTAVLDSFYQEEADVVSASVAVGNVVDVGIGRRLLVLKIAEKNSCLKTYGIDVSQKAAKAATRILEDPSLKFRSVWSLAASFFS